MVAISDDFNRADGGLGASWTAIANGTVTGEDGGVVDSNAFGLSADTGTTRSGSYHATTMSGDGSVKLQIAEWSAPSGAYTAGLGVYIHGGTNGQDGWSAVLLKHENDELRLYLFEGMPGWNSASDDPLASGWLDAAGSVSLSGVAPDVGDVLEVRRVGTRIYGIYRRGAGEQGRRTFGINVDGGHTAGDKVGIFAFHLGADAETVAMRADSFDAYSRELRFPTRLGPTGSYTPPYPGLNATGLYTALSVPRYGVAHYGALPYAGYVPAVLPIDTGRGLPALMANDRHQLIAVIDDGSATSPPEFRQWYGGPVEWAELAGARSRSQVVPRYAARDDGTLVDGVVELAAVALGKGSMCTVEALLVEVSLRPSSIGILDGGVDGDTLLGFDAYAEGWRAEDVRTTDGAGHTGAVVRSETISWSIAAGEVDASYFPATFAVRVPCVIEEQVRSVRAGITNLRGLELVSVELYGETFPSRIA